MTDSTTPESTTPPATPETADVPEVSRDALHMIAALSGHLHEQLGEYLSIPDSPEGYRRLAQTMRTLGEVSTFYATKIDELLKKEEMKND